MITVLLADDQALVRAGFRALLNAQADVEVVGEAADGAEAVALARSHRPDVVLMDIRMPGTDGLVATRAITADDRLGSVRIVILTTFDLDEYLFEAIRAGASGFLLKDVPPEDLVHAIRVIAGGDALIAPSITRRLLDRFGTRNGLTLGVFWYSVAAMLTSLATGLRSFCGLRFLLGVGEAVLAAGVRVQAGVEGGPAGAAR